MPSRTKYLLLAPIFSALLSISAVEAAPIDLGTFTGGSHSNSATFGNQVSGSFLDEYLFTTTNLSRVGVTVTNDYETADAFIDAFTIRLYSGPPSSTAPIATATDPNFVTSDGSGFQFVGVKGVQPAGTYYFTVSGVTGDTPSYGGSLNISISTVPLPGSAPLFGAALLALGAIGYGAKRRTVAGEPPVAV